MHSIIIKIINSYSRRYNKTKETCVAKPSLFFTEFFFVFFCVLEGGIGKVGRNWFQLSTCNEKVGEDGSPSTSEDLYFFFLMFSFFYLF